MHYTTLSVQTVLGTKQTPFDFPLRLSEHVRLRDSERCLEEGEFKCIQTHSPYEVYQRRNESQLISR
eukprot:400231-Rhodomonas_salina.1